MALTDSKIGNIKHLHGAVRLIRRSLTDTNPALDMLNAYCLLFLGASNNKNLRDEMRSSYINAYQEFRLRSNNNLDYFYSNILRFKHEIQKDGRNVINNHDMSIINEWDAQDELIIH